MPRIYFSDQNIPPAVVMGGPCMILPMTESVDSMEQMIVLALVQAVVSIDRTTLSVLISEYDKASTSPVLPEDVRQRSRDTKRVLHMFDEAIAEADLSGRT